MIEILVPAHITVSVQTTLLRGSFLLFSDNPSFPSQLEFSDSVVVLRHTSSDSTSFNTPFLLAWSHMMSV